MMTPLDEWPSELDNPEGDEDVPSDNDVAKDEKAAFINALAGREVGDLVPFPHVFKIGSHEFTHAVVEKHFKTASRAQLLRLLPGDAHFILKWESLRREHAVMSALHYMNRRWRHANLRVRGQVVQAVTYSITPVGDEAGLVEVVDDSWTLRELSRKCVTEERPTRILRALDWERGKLDKLAASTVAYLTATYALGIRDGHDDNIMLREDGALFRIDFGFIFGDTPEIDTPQTIIPFAVKVALGDERWQEVIEACGRALEVLSGDLDFEPPAWECLRDVPELSPLLLTAHEHTRTLSFDQFIADVWQADQWSLQRATKNAIREMLQMFRDGSSGSSTTADLQQQKLDASSPSSCQSPPTGMTVGPLAPDDPFAAGRPRRSGMSSTKDDLGMATNLPPDDPFLSTPPSSARAQESAKVSTTSREWVRAWM